jgi:hypothetical protein
MINERAPVIAMSEIEVRASQDVVWRTLTDFESWPRWNRAVRSLAIEGEVEPGTVFRWRSGLNSIVSTVRRVEAPRLISWTGRTPGIDAAHVFRLAPGAGRTQVYSEESWAGLLPALLKGRLRRTLEKSLEEGLEALKAEAERRAET